MVDSNIIGLLYVAKAIIPTLRKQNSAYIFNLGSLASKIPYIGGNVYCGTTAFVGHCSKDIIND